MEYLTLRKDLRNIDLKSLYFGGHYKIRGFFITYYSESEDELAASMSFCVIKRLKISELSGFK